MDKLQWAIFYYLKEHLTVYYKHSRWHLNMKKIFLCWNILVAFSQKNLFRDKRFAIWKPFLNFESMLFIRKTPNKFSTPIWPKFVVMNRKFEKKLINWVLKYFQGQQRFTHSWMGIIWVYLNMYVSMKISQILTGTVTKFKVKKFYRAKLLRSGWKGCDKVGAS